MWGTFVNAVAVVVGSLLGILFKNLISKSIQTKVLQILGVLIVVIGATWFMQHGASWVFYDATIAWELLVIASVVIGLIIGEWLRIDDHFQAFSKRVENTLKMPSFAQGFLNATIIFCVGSMAILGSFQDGLTGNPSVLYVKSTLDFITSMIMSSVLGIGVMFSALSILIYQGSLTWLAGSLSTVLVGAPLLALSTVGDILIIAIGINFTETMKIKVANLLPALVVPLLYYFVSSLLK